MCDLWWRRDRTMTWPIIQVHSMPKKKLNCHERSDNVWSMKKNRKDNDMTDCTSEVYAEIGIELSWLIGHDVIYHKKQIWQRLDWSYRCELCKIQCRIVVTDPIMCGLWWRWNRTTTWSIVQVCSMPKTKLNYHNWSNSVYDEHQIEQHVTNCTTMINAEIRTEMS